jgi:hypothetical protein
MLKVGMLKAGMLKAGMLKVRTFNIQPVNLQPYAGNEKKLTGLEAIHQQQLARRKSSPRRQVGW